MEQHKSRNRTRRRLVATAAAVVVAAAGLSITAMAPAAQAYDGNTCSAGMRADVDQFRVDTGANNVDFGDDYHIGGAPQGTAVVCWGTGGSSVYLKGKLFWDSSGSGCADVEVAVFRDNNTLASSQGYSELCSSGGLRSKVIEHSMFSNAGDLDRIRIRLFRRGPDLGAQTIVATPTIGFGD